MKNWFTYCLRLLVLLAFTFNASGVYAVDWTTSGTYKEIVSLPYTCNITIEKDVHITIDGYLTMNNGGSLGAYGGTLVVKGSLYIKGNLTLKKSCTLKLEEGSSLVVDGNLDQQAGFLVYSSIDANKAKIVVTGNYTASSSLLGSDVLDPKNNEVYVFGSSVVAGTGNQQAAFEAKYASYEEFLPIELTSFTVSPTVNGYTFNWVTASEVENDYFTLEFSENGEEFIAIDYVSGAGTTSETTEYDYVWDAKPTADVLYFRLKQTDYNGEFTYSDILVFAPKKSHGANRILYYGPLKLNVVDGQLQYIVE